MPNQNNRTRPKPRELPPKLPPDLCPSTPGEWISYVCAVDLRRGLKLMMSVLLKHINWTTGENAYPTQKTLAQECGCSVTQVQNDLGALVTAGEVKKETRKTRTGNRGNHYRLTPRETNPAWSRADTKSVRSDTKSVECDTKSVGLRDQAHLAGTSPIEPPPTEPPPSEPARVRARAETNGKAPRDPFPQADAPQRIDGPQTLRPLPAETNPAWSHADEPNWPTILKHVPRGRLGLYLGPVQLVALGFGFERGVVVGWPRWYVGGVPEQVPA